MLKTGTDQNNAKSYQIAKITSQKNTKAATHVFPMNCGSIPCRGEKI